MNDYDVKIKSYVTEVNKLLGKRTLTNLTYDDLKVYMRSGVKKKKGNVKKIKFPTVVITIPRIDKYVGGNSDRYKVGHRIVVPFFQSQENEFNLRNEEVINKVMDYVKEHGEKYFSLNKSEIKRPK